MKRQLVNISRYAGMREDLVQAGGGNTSVKISDTEMLIKASGYQLADVTEESGYAVVNHQIISSFFKSSDLDSVSKAEERMLLEKSFVSGERPSIETFLHAITGKVTLHTHPVIVNILAARCDGVDLLRRLFPSAVFVEYATPGIELAKAYFKALKNHKGKTDIIFLKNHGLIVSGENDQSVRELTENVITVAASELGIDNRRYVGCSVLRDALVNAGVDDRIVVLMKSCDIYGAYHKNGQKLWKHSFCPDAVVYCGKRIMVLADNFGMEEVRSFISESGIPSVIFYNKNFYAVAADVKKAKEIESLFSFTAEVVSNNKEEDLVLLSDEEQNFLLNWDAEKYRKNMK